MAANRRYNCGSLYRRRKKPLVLGGHERGAPGEAIANEEDALADVDASHHWTSQTLAIALPALAGMMTDPLLSLVDTLFVGRLGAPSAASSVSAVASSSVPLAALGACTSIFHLSFHCFRATTLSTSSLVAGALVRDEQNAEQCGEDGKKKEAVLIARTSIQQALITGVLITSFLLAFGPRCLFAMGITPPTVSGKNELFPSALTYLNHRSVAAPAVVVLAASEGIFRGYGDVITPWKVSCVVALLNLVLDPFCMFSGKGRWMGLGMGIKGAAIATAFSQVCGALLYGRWLFRKGLMGAWRKKKNNSDSLEEQMALKQQKRTIASAILKANAAMMAKQGSLLLGWAYATSRATRMGNAVVASHQVALSIWLVVALVLEGAGVAAQVLMSREWEGLQVLERKLTMTADEDDISGEKEDIGTEKKRRTIRSLSLYMIGLSLVQGCIGSLAMLMLRQAAPNTIMTEDPAVRQNLLKLLPHIAGQMALVSITLVTEALAIGGGRFKWLAGGTTISSVVAMVKLREAKDLVAIWSSGIVALFLGRLVTALLAVLDMNGLFSWRKRAQRARDCMGTSEEVTL
ncbi:hypothetical protein ACHAXT_010819 [Thalassiosira profunda]